VLFKKSADRHLAISNAKAARGRVESALAHYRQAEKIARAAGSADEVGKALNNQGLMERGKGNLGEALSLFEKAESFFKVANNTQELAKAYNNQGAILAGNGKNEEALILFKEKEDLSRSIMDFVGVGRSLINQGAALLGIGRSDDAVGCFTSGFETCAAHGDMQGAGEAAFNIGSFYRDHARDPDIANPIRFFTMGIRCFMDAGDRKGQEKCQHAVAQIRKKNPEGFEQALKRASDDLNQILNA
jgi:tetratricopeptide (TPR) repeat protein